MPPVGAAAGSRKSCRLGSSSIACRPCWQAAVRGLPPLPAAGGRGRRPAAAAAWSVAAAACFQLLPQQTARRRSRRLAASPVVEEAPASPIVPAGSRLQAAVGGRSRVTFSGPQILCHIYAICAKFMQKICTICKTICSICKEICSICEYAKKCKK